MAAVPVSGALRADEDAEHSPVFWALRADGVEKLIRYRPDKPAQAGFATVARGFWSLSN
ncbi:MAG: hypothetical protein RMJ48_00020 [Roseiflexaceae bacterium]|nr:hypothetical protein [Roseiflexaceae bacterium]